MHKVTCFKQFGAALLLALALAVTAFAQTSASLSGTVQDPQGNAVSGAKVTAADTSKNQSFDTKTSSDGTFSGIAIYHFHPLTQPGRRLGA